MEVLCFHLEACERGLSVWDCGVSAAVLTESWLRAGCWSVSVLNERLEEAVCVSHCVINTHFMQFGGGWPQVSGVATDLGQIFGAYRQCGWAFPKNSLLRSWSDAGVVKRRVEGAVQDSDFLVVKSSHCFSVGVKASHFRLLFALKTSVSSALSFNLLETPPRLHNHDWLKLYEVPHFLCFFS